MPLSTILEHEPISFNEMAVQENTQAAPLPGCTLESKTRHTFSLKASALMATLPSPINPTSRPMTPDSLFSEISNPQNVACPVPHGPIPPIFLRCRTCWRKDHPTGSEKCEFQQLRIYWKAEYEEELYKQNNLSKTQLAILATSYYQIQASYDDVLAKLDQLELENSLLRAANTQLHADVNYLHHRQALDPHDVRELFSSVRFR